MKTKRTEYFKKTKKTKRMGNRKDERLKEGEKTKTDVAFFSTIPVSYPIP